MAIELARLIDSIQPEKTVLLFGAGSSVPSHAPTGAQLTSYLAETFKINAEGFSLSELASLVEQQCSRKALVDALRAKFKGLRPTGGLLNLPLYN